MAVASCGYDRQFVPAVVAMAFAVGLCLRRRESLTFAVLFRSQMVLLGSSMALLAGWTFAWRSEELAGLVVLLAGELAALRIGWVLFRRGCVDPLTVVSSTSNSGFWSIPVAGALAGAPGAAFAVLYDTIGALRGFVVLRLLRREAPAGVPARSALVDYLPQMALVLGLAIRPVASPPDVDNWLPLMGSMLGAVGFLLLGMAMPHCRPGSHDWRAAMPVLALRFGLPVAMCVVAAALGVRLPDAAWVVALAPTPFAVVSFARLYGYRRERAAAVPLVSVPLATALLPVVRLLVR